ncbi:hypothetical protein [Chitinophaga sp. YIM B06452]|uniref:hypothetical protein n=1 Tax=Chitinophaga sp. YIM B06452 TaxID=3082158 RepID=UPI0031FEBE74
MSFLFGLFRFLTWGNIIVAGFFLLFVVMALLVAPSPLEVITSMFFLGSVLYHNILCTQLQRTLSNPEVPLPPSLPRVILITGIIAFIYAILVAIQMIGLGRLSDEEMIRLMKVNNAQNTQGITVEELASAVRKAVLVLGSIHALAIAVNCELSRIFFNRWRKDQEPAEEDSFFDINNPDNP